jgi:hypothetical protein
MESPEFFKSRRSYAELSLLGATPPMIAGKTCLRLCAAFSCRSGQPMRRIWMLPSGTLDVRQLSLQAIWPGNVA